MFFEKFLDLFSEHEEKSRRKTHVMTTSLLKFSIVGALIASFNFQTVFGSDLEDELRRMEWQRKVDEQRRESEAFMERARQEAEQMRLKAEIEEQQRKAERARQELQDQLERQQREMEAQRREMERQQRETKYKSLGFD
jgi:hypothetical protein